MFFCKMIFERLQIETKKYKFKTLKRYLEINWKEKLTKGAIKK